MKKILSLALICLLILPALVACSSSKESFTAFETEDAYDYEMKAENANGALGNIFYDSVSDGSYAEPEAPMEKPEMEETGTTDPLANRKIIYSASYSIETKEFDKSVARLDELCKSFGGWYESSNSYGTAESANRNAYFTVRIPTENYRAFTDSQSSVGTVVSSSENNRDVTEQYTDTEARLESALLREQRVLVILENAASLDDVLALERELSDIRYEIESLTGSLRKYDSLVDFSTVNVSIREVSVYTPKDPVVLTFSERMAKGFKSGIENFVDFVQSFLVFLSYNLIGLVFFVAVIIIVVVIVMKKLRKKNKKEETQTEKKDMKAE